MASRQCSIVLPVIHGVHSRFGAFVVHNDIWVLFADLYLWNFITYIVLIMSWKVPIFDWRKWCNVDLYRTTTWINFLWLCAYSVEPFQNDSVLWKTTVLLEYGRQHLRLLERPPKNQHMTMLLIEMSLLCHFGHCRIMLSHLPSLAIKWHVSETSYTKYHSHHHYYKQHGECHCNSLIIPAQHFRGNLLLNDIWFYKKVNLMWLTLHSMWY